MTKLSFFSVCEGLEDVSKIPKLMAALSASGWSDSELIKLASKNILRVFSEVEKVHY